MRDVARDADNRGITLDRVGIRDLDLPIRIRQKAGGEARVVGVFDSTVELAHHERGTHMSRFVEALARWSKKRVDQSAMREILTELGSLFACRAAYVSMSFQYFLGKTTPISRLACQLDYDCRFDAKMVGDEFSFALEVGVPVLTVCPCSLEIACTGAHSQRAIVKARVGTELGALVWLEDIIPLLEHQGSYEVFPILKREDEKHVTEKAFENPKFVEDVVRDSVLAVQGIKGVLWYEVTCDSMESIHNHNAYAFASGGDGIWSLR